MFESTISQVFYILHAFSMLVSRQRLAWECEGACDVEEVQKERARIMDNTNPRVVLRNYIAQNAIEAAENGDFSEVKLPLCLIFLLITTSRENPLIFNNVHVIQYES